MTDLSKTIDSKSDQQNYDDYISNPSRTIRITAVRGCEGDQPISIDFEGDGGKPYKPCKSMRRVLVRIWGNDGNSYVGKSMTLYGDPKVKFGGIEVGGIRISHMSHMDKAVSMPLTASKAKRIQYKVEPLRDAPAAVDPAEALVKAQAAADGGSNAFTTWWQSDEGKTMREAVREHMDDLKARAEAADTPADDGKPSPEEMEAAERAAKEAGHGP